MNVSPDDFLLLSGFFVCTLKKGDFLQGEVNFVKNPCGTAQANIVEGTEINGIPVFWGTGFNPLNSSQFFVSWGEKLMEGDLLPTYNSDNGEKGLLWFSDEDSAEKKYKELQQLFAASQSNL